MLRFRDIVLYLILFVMVICIAFPIYWMLLTAFQPTSQAVGYPPSFFFKSFTLNKLNEVIANSKILVWILNSFLVAAGVVVFNLIISVPAAYSIARFNINFNKVLLFIVLITQMIPQAIMVVPLFEIFSSSGLINKLLSLILADSILTLPLGTWILIGFFQNVPHEIEEAAIVDGASRLMLFYRINVPLVYPAMVTVAIMAFFDTWNEYMYAYTFITDQAKWVGTVGIASFMGQFLTDWQTVMASSFLFSIAPMLIYLFLRKHIVRGVAEGFSK